MATQKNTPTAASDEAPRDFAETEQFDMSTMPMGLEFLAGENINLDESHQNELDQQAKQAKRSPQAPAQPAAPAKPE
jgi:hypothetical protein